MAGSLTIPSRFNGPQASGNGGYSAGAVAALVGGAAEVSLRSPVPLDKPLDVVHDDETVRVVDGETLVAEAQAAADFEIDVPEPVAVGQARDAMARYRGAPSGEFSNCFVCGLQREDSFEVFAGQVDGRDVVASTWTPPAWTAGDDGNVRPEFVWAVMDCPTYFAAHVGQDLTISFMARMAARVDAPVAAGKEHVVMSWPLGLDGRKRHAGVAVMSGDGTTLASGQVLLIQAR